MNGVVYRLINNKTGGDYIGCTTIPQAKTNNNSMNLIDLLLNHPTDNGPRIMPESFSTTEEDHTEDEVEFIREDEQYKYETDATKQTLIEHESDTPCHTLIARTDFYDTGCGC